MAVAFAPNAMPSLPLRSASLLLVSLLGACGGSAGSRLDPGADVTFEYDVPNVCPSGSCPESTPVAAGTRVRMIVRGLPPYQELHTRLSRTDVVKVEAETTIWYCASEDPAHGRTRWLTHDKRCEANERPITLHRVILQTIAEGDALLEVLDERNETLDVTKIRSKVPTIVGATLRVRPDPFGPDTVTANSAPDNAVEVPLGAGLTVRPFSYWGNEQLAFSEGIAAEISPQGIFERVETVPRGGNPPESGTVLFRAAATGDASISVALGDRTWSMPVRVVP